MIFIGDVHGLFADYKELLKKLPGPSIQLGDMGIGFNPRLDNIFPIYVERHRWIRGNHDNPETCKKFQNYLGDFGYLKDENIFYVSGAWSIDRKFRTENVDWWKGEELDAATMDKVVKLYTEIKPRIMATHDCPSDILPYVTGHQNNHRTSTTTLFNHLFSIHKPEWWVFAHHHKSFDFTIDGTRFLVLGELRWAELPIKVDEEVSIIYNGNRFVEEQ